ncbi:sialyltransferase [Chloropicon primus]|uniref:Sialyltransferase n=1 Tax=Chloropicon primus TaxID=1764295 RepID=A0A5B8MQR0_9CHLO|nr:sialyltransferase [Chloropicon primus]UPR00853.1 sialyltransferase [Chloropicon primus]|eukprot:QDZ21642.1 sialyltransferase [Chloropicon primus]
MLDIRTRRKARQRPLLARKRVLVPIALAVCVTWFYLAGWNFQRLDHSNSSTVLERDLRVGSEAEAVTTTTSSSVPSSESQEQAVAGTKEDGRTGEQAAGAGESQNATRFDRQVLQLLGKKQSIVYLRERLTSKRPFSCGGTKTVKLNSAKNLAKTHSGLEKLVPLEDPIPARNLSCAVVGNGGNLLETQFGRSIDEADAVIRFNAAVTDGYEEFVGSKTTYRILNRPQSQERYQSSVEANETTLTMLRDNGDLKAWVRGVRGIVPASEHAGGPGSYFLDFEFLCHAWRFVRKRGERPSSGLVGIVLAVHLCKHGRIDVFGFHSENYFSESTRPHYYDWERPKKGRERVHPFAMERKVYESLERFGVVRLHS